MVKVKLGKVADIITGPFGSMLHKSDYLVKGIPVIMPQDIGDRVLSFEKIVYVGQADATRLSKYLTIENDIVYARRGDVEKHAFISNEESGALCGTGCLRVRINKDEADPLYISFYLNRPESKAWIRRHAVGSNMLNINTELLSELPLEMPDLETQQRVANLLNTIDDKINNNKRLIDELEDTARLIYDYWFTQFDFPDENGKTYRSSGGKMVWNDELKREIPNGWNACKIGDLVEDVRTGLNPRNNFRLTNTGWAYLTVKNLTLTGEIDFSSCDYIDDNAREMAHRRSDVSKGDILFSSISPLGRCHLVCKDPDAWEINESVFSIRPNTDIASPEYLYLLLTSPWFVKTAEGSSAGSVFKGIRHEELKAIKTIAPEANTMESFTEVVRPLLKQKEKLSNENMELIKLRDWLLPMLMNGQVVVES